MAIDSKYGEVSIQRGDIGEDEPVFLFRAKDALAVEGIRRYRDLCSENGAPQDHLDRLDVAMKRINEWQRDHLTHIPGTRKDGNG